MRRKMKDKWVGNINICEVGQEGGDCERLRRKDNRDIGEREESA